MGRLYQSGAGGPHVWTVSELASQLASFRGYTPEPNGLDGVCSMGGCGGPVPAGAGWVLLGGMNGDIWAVVLCRACAAAVAREQGTAVTCTCDAIVTGEQALREHCAGAPCVHASPGTEGRRVMGADEAVVATTEKAEIVLTPYGFYSRCTAGCPWASEYTPSKYRTRMDAVMHDEDPDRAPLHTKAAGR